MVIVVCNRIYLSDELEIVNSALLYTRFANAVSDWPKIFSWRKLTSVHGRDGNSACSTTAVLIYSVSLSHNKNADIVDEAQTLSSCCTPQGAPTCPDITTCQHTLFAVNHSLTIKPLTFVPRPTY